MQHVCNAHGPKIVAFIGNPDLNVTADMLLVGHIGEMYTHSLESFTSSLSYDRSIASSKASSPCGAI